MCLSVILPILIVLKERCLCFPLRRICPCHAQTLSPIPIAQCLNAANNHNLASLLLWPVPAKQLAFRWVELGLQSATSECDRNQPFLSGTDAQH